MTTHTLTSLPSHALILQDEGDVTEWEECQDCKRALKTPESRRLGYGPECARRHGLAPKKPRRTPRAPRPARSLSCKPARVPPAPDALPGQTELDLYFHQPTLESL